MYKSIIGEELQSNLVNEFFDSHRFGDQHWYAARAEILALKERIDELENQYGKSAKGSNHKSVTVDKEK